jgi:DNA repair protein RecO (recombination protein O)
LGCGGLPTYKTRAIVIKTQDLGEADKLVWLFSEKFGKISCIAKGAKKSKSKFLALSLPFCYGEFVVYKGKNLYTISEGEIIDSFQDLLKDLDILTYALYLCELIDIAMQNEETNAELFKQLITALLLIKSNAVDMETLVRAFEIKFLKATGYDLNLEKCCICRKTMQTSNYISFQFSGGVCERCTRVNGIYISFAAYNTLKFFNKIPLEKVYRIILNNGVKEELSKVISVIISQNYFKIPKSLEMLNYLKRSEKNE